MFISWQKKHNFIAQRCTQTIKPTVVTKCDSRAACLPNAFISWISSNIFSLNMNYIANRNKSILRRAQRNWRPLQIAMNEQSCVTVWILCFQNIPNSKRVFNLLRQCAVLAVLLHTTMLRETFAAVRRQTHTHTLIEINGFPQCSMLTVHHCSIERIHQNQPCALHNLQPPPTLTHWFPTHGGVMPECDYKMPFDASMTDTWPSHVTYILCIWISCSWKQCFIIPISPVFCLRGIWPPSMLLFWDHHTPLWHCL